MCPASVRSRPWIGLCKASVFAIGFDDGLWCELLHEGAGVIAEALMFGDARVKAVFGLHVDLRIGAIGKGLFFLHLELSKRSCRFNLL